MTVQSYEFLPIVLWQCWFGIRTTFYVVGWLNGWSLMALSSQAVYIMPQKS